MSLWVLAEVARRNEAAREAEAQRPYPQNPNEGSAPLPPAEGGYDTTAGTPGMRARLPDHR